MWLIHPHWTAPSVHAVDYDGLRACGVRAILFDLENTLGPWRAGELDPRTWSLLDRLRAQGFRIAVLTNADLPPGHPLLQALRKRGVSAVARARKPLGRGFRRALQELRVEPGQAAIVGDQLLTDVLGGRRAGLFTVLVDPLSPRESFPTRFNRGIERLLGRRVRFSSGAP
ncbi:MAG: YqeG family HAD IIIA-type phosphatase [Candidatus Bipolaricaulota bacterium]|nr:YqeG family HAD IIIA-type phosphatase [Candidatus Bipolaricaulota bacterium]